MSESSSNQSKLSGVFWGSGLILLGVIFLLDRLDFMDAGEIFGTFWPAILILIGVKLILNARSKPDGQESKSEATEAENKISGNQIVRFSKVFGDVRLKFDSKDFKGGNISTVFGDLNIDLSETNIRSGERVVTLNGVFGDITVSVPKNLAIVVRANVIAGDVTIFDEKSGGLFINKMYKSEDYESSK
ncbi:MAG: cell wall-active antibiotics response protein LiaF, partial [bacterium]